MYIDFVWNAKEGDPLALHDTVAVSNSEWYGGPSFQTT